jgi:putative hydrolase of the HAD superfamily
MNHHNALQQAPLSTKSLHPTYKNIIFDIGGVLLEWNPPKFLPRYFQDQEIIGKYKQLFKSEAWLNYDRGITTIEQTAEHIDPTLDKQRFINFCKTLHNVLMPQQKVIDLMIKLKQMGYKIYILSNFPQELFHDVYEKNNFFKEPHGMTISYRIGSLKPEPNIYQILLTEHNLKPEECFFIDDRAENIEGSRACGIEGVVFANYNSLEEDLKKLKIL